MQTRLINPVRDSALDSGILSYLPAALAAEIGSLSIPRIDEIRLRCDQGCSVTVDGRNLALRTRIGRREIDETLRRICDGSLYAYSDTISRGYITMSGGIRVGVCGRAVTERGRITGVYDISSICIRLPHRVPSVGEPVVELLKNDGYRRGVLIFSPPGVGKTTLLRALIIKLSGGRAPLRIAVIDTRGELSAFLPDGLLVDLLSGYPKGQGIEIATRTLNPQIIVCDELSGNSAEAEAVASAHNSGVALLASAHAASVSELLLKRSLSSLIGSGIFSYYVGISRNGSHDYTYDITRSDGI